VGWAPVVYGVKKEVMDSDSSDDGRDEQDRIRRV